MSRFEKGQSGNPDGRPKQRRPHVSAFDIVFDQTLIMTQGGVERELTVDEALQLQTYHAGLKGSRMAVRAVLKMIEKREVALAKRNPTVQRGARMEVEHDSDNAEEALRILGIAVDGHVPPGGGEGARTLKLANWAAQAAIRRPGRRGFSDKDREDIARYTLDPDKLRWPRGKRANPA
ncbi:MAG: hypothetical protein FP826_11320 [Sphingomonadales bacterium]|nr:hypothetical protein [Sphingomonadales bacterium]MBU3991646.1 hypothetical protein [Alphaproteobacteria bacterium]